MATCDKMDMPHQMTLSKNARLERVQTTWLMTRHTQILARWIFCVARASPRVPLPFAEVDSGHTEAFAVVSIKLEQNTKVGAPVSHRRRGYGRREELYLKVSRRGGGAVSGYGQDTLYTCMKLPRKRLTLFSRVGNGGQWESALSLIFSMPRALCWWKTDWPLLHVNLLCGESPCRLELGWMVLNPLRQHSKLHTQGFTVSAPLSLKCSL